MPSLLDNSGRRSARLELGRRFFGFEAEPDQTVDESSEESGGAGGFGIEIVDQVPVELERGEDEVVGFFFLRTDLGDA